MRAAKSIIQIFLTVNRMTCVLAPLRYSQVRFITFFKSKNTKPMFDIRHKLNKLQGLYLQLIYNLQLTKISNA